uniref:Uncharacterized protein n=1 Tax=Poecilia reticulata TaxID=8081 RepID=A0A3P9QG69_POERE
MAKSSGESPDSMCRIKYVIGDLFSAPNQESLAHCVTLFKKNFGPTSELKEQSESFFAIGTLYLKK